MQREAVILFNLTLVLALAGVLMVFSASPVPAVRTFGMDPLHFADRQMKFAVVGFFLLLLMTRFDYHRLADKGVLFLIFVGAIVLQLAVVFSEFGAEAGGATRWLGVGALRFQPSEIAKASLVVLLAALLYKRKDHLRKFWFGFLPPMILVGLFAGLVAMQKDIGTPVVMVAVMGVMLIAAGARIGHMIVCGVVAVCGFIALVVIEPHRITRLYAYRDPWASPSDEGLQLIQSMTAFARGGLFGQGAGAGEQKLLHLPAAHTDFIFAVWAEELGFIGSVALVCVFALVMLMAFRVAQRAPDFFGSMLAMGIGTLVTVQALLNMMVSTGLVPTKGLSLPFISAGGSGLLVHMALMGILVNIALQGDAPERERLLGRSKRAAA
mgnify:CR=1 FL=1